MGTHDFFVANDAAGSRKDTAVLLVGTATEFGISQRDILATSRQGFYISEALANVLYDEAKEDEVSGNSAKSSPKTSGDRAAKKTGTSRSKKKE